MIYLTHVRFGIAGCVVATRISEAPDWKILLVETGPLEVFL